jgi:hypothetical protein
MKYIAWTTYSINLCIDWASEKSIEELEKNIQGFIEEQSAFEYFEYTEDKTNWDKTYSLRSVNGQSSYQ